MCASCVTTPPGSTVKRHTATHQCASTRRCVSLAVPRDGAVSNRHTAPSRGTLGEYGMSYMRHTGVPLDGTVCLLLCFLTAPSATGTRRCLEALWCVAVCLLTTPPYTRTQTYTRMHAHTHTHTHTHAHAHTQCASPRRHQESHGGGKSKVRLIIDSKCTSELAF